MTKKDLAEYNRLRDKLQDAERKSARARTEASAQKYEGLAAKIGADLDRMIETLGEALMPPSTPCNRYAPWCDKGRW